LRLKIKVSGGTMKHQSTMDVVRDLEAAGQLVRIRRPVDPYLEMAEIQRHIYRKRGPAILFENVKGSSFPAISNIYGTPERVHYLFRKSFERTRMAMQAFGDPVSILKKPLSLAQLPLAGLYSLPQNVKKAKNAPVMENETSLSKLPQIVSWPEDGGAFVTLPQVCTQDPEKPGIMKSNLGMYRIQLSGNEYVADQEAGMHYQIHRGIGIHHTRALERGQDLKVSIFVGGPPAHAFAAMMPMPEGMAEATFAGLLGGQRFRWLEEDGWIISADADFCILGTISPEQKPEGPFGDHLGYYSLAHDFPYLKIHKVYHRNDAVWPFTVVGRPPQEDTTFGQVVHELTGKVLPTQLPGVREVHAVDAAGVHPLLLAIGSERYVPYDKREPREILTQANAILGFNQISLSKYLWIAAGEDRKDLSTSRIVDFFTHCLARVDWTRDLHFQTSTTIDTLDYSGDGLNKGSKLVVAAAGEPCRTLLPMLPGGFSLPEGFSKARMAFPGVLVVQGPKFIAGDTADIKRLSSHLEDTEQYKTSEGDIAWIVVCDDTDFTAENPDNFLWVTFLRSNPSADTFGVHEFMHNKHWGCRGPMITDARIKPHHAKPLIEDKAVLEKVKTYFEPGGELERWK